MYFWRQPNRYDMIRISLKINGRLFGHKQEPKERARRRETNVLFADYANRFITSSADRVSHSCIKNYITALNSFEKFQGDRSISLNGITPSVINAYSQWLKLRHISDNTASCYMRSLRAIYNSAVKRKLVAQKLPFCNVFTGNRKTAKRAITQRDITKIMSLQFADGTNVQLAHHIFTFCLLAMGMPFVDVYCLRKSQIRNGVLNYCRHKTGQMVSVVIEKNMKAIISRYARPDSDFVFPLKQNPDKFVDNVYRHTLYKYNKQLKRIADKAGINENLSSYVARHTWASMAFRENIPLPTISQALGHSSTATTLIYIKELGLSRMAAMNNRIIRKFLSPSAVKAPASTCEPCPTNSMPASPAVQCCCDDSSLQEQ
jgi:integrase/recombinase XerD